MGGFHVAEHLVPTEGGGQGSASRYLVCWFLEISGRREGPRAARLLLVTGPGWGWRNCMLEWGTAPSGCGHPVVSMFEGRRCARSCPTRPPDKSMPVVPTGILHGCASFLGIVDATPWHLQHQ